MEAYCQEHTTSPLASRARPADTSADSRLPGADRA
jgi:hypothetical protein